MIYRPSELIPFLRDHLLHPKRALSQTFLTDGNIIRKMCKALDIDNTTSVVEIGPGPGGITSHLLEEGAEVTAVEKDPELAQLLHRLQTEDQRLCVVQGDILEIDLEELPKPSIIISNLPFNLAPKILCRLVHHRAQFPRIGVLVQDEVAKRMAAKPRSKAYGSLSVYLQLFSDVKYAFKVSRNTFYPRPRVDAAFIIFKPRLPLGGASEEVTEIIRMGFSQRRKMLVQNLRTLFDRERVIQVLQEQGLSPNSRAEELTPQELVSVVVGLGDPE